ncbi:MAG: ATP-dependent nuclease [Candidatus Nitrosopumilus sp. bin_68KS]
MSEVYDIPPLELSYIKHTWELKNLMPITLIFGKNGSGKSTYLKTLNRVKNTNTTQSKDFNFKYSAFYILPERTGKFEITNTHPSNIQSQQNNMQFSESNYVANFNEYALLEFNNLFSKIGHRYNKDFKFDLTSDYILNEVSTFFPNYKIEFNTMASRLDVFKDGEGINSSLLSSGESQLVSICILLLTQIANWKLNNEEGVILFDEPDLHLDPQMQERLALLISNLQKKYNVKFLIATHSIIFMTTLSLLHKNIGSIHLDRSKKQLFAKKLNDKMIDFELFLNGKFLMGTLNEIPLLLVEGSDESLIFQTATRSHSFNAYVFPCNGDEIYRYQEFAEKLFNSCYDHDNIFGCALLDSDKKMKTTAQNFIKFIKLSCNESENLYFTNEVLESMMPDKTLLSEKLKKLNIGDKLSDKQNADFKPIIHNVAKELDPDNLTWQERVGKNIGKQRPTGELASFLGDDLLNVIWPLS